MTPSKRNHERKPAHDQSSGLVLKVNLSTRSRRGTTPRAVEEESPNTSVPHVAETGDKYETAGRGGEPTPRGVATVGRSVFNTTTYWYQYGTTHTTRLIRPLGSGTSHVVPRPLIVERGGETA